MILEIMKTNIYNEFSDFYKNIAVFSKAGVTLAVRKKNLSCFVSKYYMHIYITIIRNDDTQYIHLYILKNYVYFGTAICIQA